MVDESGLLEEFRLVLPELLSQPYQSKSLSKKGNRHDAEENGAHENEAQGL
jgi:hypothetical protein